MGNAYMSGGAAGFGKGGPYGGWGFGWYTMIYNDGSIYTNRLNAEGGNIRDMRIRNCVIDENCDVRGVLYAERIVGDVTKTYVISRSTSGESSVFIPATDRMVRRVSVICVVSMEISTGNGGTVFGRCTVNGVEIAKGMNALGVMLGDDRGSTISATLTGGTIIPINQSATVTVSVTNGGVVEQSLCFVEKV
ncbi:hypothetical protein PCI56_00895 [Plesiomonas shigelloides subsp. oncorhynchi]|nr:hypothetical protein [Plesiomonas shigelloides]